MLYSTHNHQHSVGFFSATVSFLRLEAQADQNGRMGSKDVPIRDAATIVLVRNTDGAASVLMGQRGANAAFMASKFVFPGGAVAQDDAKLPQAPALAPGVRSMLARDSATAPEAVAHAAIRELWEEAGLALGQTAPARQDVPPDWQSFYARFRPATDRLQFFFRAVTPPGRPRRFDARFFVCHADAVNGDLDDFSAADDELSHLQWVPIGKARELEMPFVTELVIAEIAAMLPDLEPRTRIPYFRQSLDGPGFEMISATDP